MRDPDNVFTFSVPVRPVVPEAEPIRVRDLIDAYLADARVKFRKYGRLTKSYEKARLVTQLMLSTGVGDLTIDMIGPVWLSQFRAWLASEPSQRWCRTTIADYAQVVIAIFRWAVAQQWTSPAHVDALRTLAPLRKGRTLTEDGHVMREGRKVKPVPDSVIERVLPFCSPIIADMIRLQQLTAMRPGEVVRLRRRDLVPSEHPGCLEYVVPDEVNKMSHEDRERVILFGPRAVEIVNRRTTRRMNGYLFDPREAADLEDLRRRQARVVKLWPSHTPLARRARARARGIGTRKTGQCYTTGSYRRAIERACIRAGLTPFGPNQIRHTAATSIAGAVGVAVAKEILGHSDIRTTMRYVGTLRAEAASHLAAFG